MSDFPQQRFRALYLHDELGRIQAINQWDGGEAPRFHLMRTASANHWRFRSDVSGDLAGELDALCRSEPVAAPAHHPPLLRERALALLGAASPVEAEWQGPVFVLPGSPDIDIPAATTAITASNARLLQAGMADWLPDMGHRWPFLAALWKDQAVAVCASVRIGESVHEAGVETWEVYRQRGFARSAVSEWAKAVRDLGVKPAYSTSWDNVASRGTARSLGATLMGTDFHLR